jgi:prepilin-type N-terminal cleavage/methylation domain-containing protein
MDRSQILDRRAGAERAFTLVEILIVVVILGILAAIVVPQFANASQDAKVVAFTTSVRTFADAAVLYQNTTGLYLEDSGTGDLPSGWEPYVNEDEWTNGTPIGGEWDFEFQSFGITSAFGVDFGADNPGDAFMILIDQGFDDGDLATGAFRKIDNDRYYYVLAD